MSNYYLCVRCEHNPNGSWVGVIIDCTEMGATRAKVMVDHGHSGGRRPYDEPLDVCPHFKLREDAVQLARACADEARRSMGR